MAPWRSRQPPALCLLWSPTGSRGESNKHSRAQSHASLLASVIHRGEFAAAEILHARGQSAAPRDPAAHVLGIDVHQQLCRLAARHLLAVAAGMPCRMEAEPRARRDTNALARNDAEQHGARRQAWAVDDDALAGTSQRDQVFQIRSDLAPRIRSDPYRRMRSR